MLTIVAVLLAVVFLPSPWGLVLVVAATVVDVVEAVAFVRWSRRRRPATGLETLVGSRGVATTRMAPTGRIRIQGELWSARIEGAAAVDPDTEVVVETVDNLVLVVRVA